MKDLKISLSSGVELTFNKVEDEEAKDILKKLQLLKNNPKDAKDAHVFINIRYDMGEACLNIFDISVIAVMKQTTKKECNNEVNYA